MVRNIITDLCHHLEIGIDGNLDIGNKRVIVGTPTITLSNNILTISCDTVGASIYYTLDGSTPTSSSTKYTTAVTLNHSCTIKAIAIKGNKSSIVVSQDYIAILTQWKIVGNSEVHGVGNLTSWKVSVNSIVDNNTILSCGDLGQDGKYHVKISNGVTIYDIPLTEPLRKTGDNADTIEFPSATDGKALVTRNIKKIVINPNEIIASEFGAYRLAVISDILSGDNDTIRTLNNLYADVSMNNRGASNVAPPRVYIQGSGVLIRGTEVQQQGGDVSTYKQELTDFYANGGTFDVLYALATPTTELIDVSPIAVSPTDTYTSANDTPYSSFEHTEHKEIWSCGEYNAADGKYHILVQPQGGSIADIALTEPLRMIDDVADSIEFPSETEGKALVTRPLKSINLYDYINSIARSNTGKTSTDGIYAYNITQLSDALPPPTNRTPINGLCSVYIVGHRSDTYNPNKRAISVAENKVCHIYDPDFDGADDIDAFKAYITEVKPEFIYELATPTTELVDAPQIAEAESYSCVISQGGKAVSWSSFTPNPS